MKLAQPPLPPSGARAHFADGLFAWWLLRRAASDAAAEPVERDDAVDRWEDEGGNSR
jgi:hypothetical protein